MATQVKTRARRRGFTRLSAKNQVTIPVSALTEAGIAPGEEFRVVVAGPGRITLERVEHPVDRFAGALTGVFPPGFLEQLRSE